MDDTTRNIRGIGALDDTVRRELYLYVSAQADPVGREQAARAFGIPAHQAKFHLDRLEEAGLLVSGYVRLTGRSGPGAGRPAKVYRRRDEEISVSLPGREYALAGELMATAIDEAADQGTPVADALDRAARTRGQEIGNAASGDGTPLDIAMEALRRFGYEPHLEGDRAVTANCPFHALAKTHTKLVCTMNHALLDGLCQRIGGLTASLQPGEGRCCVVLMPQASRDDFACRPPAHEWGTRRVGRGPGPAEPPEHPRRDVAPKEVGSA
jgi:predicted ArsR family transcriptional regulator